jgi:hypothetical protein
MRRAARALAGLAVLGLVLVGLLDVLSPRLEVSSCPSDNLSTVTAALREYRQQHAGRWPTDIEVFRTFLLQSRGHDYLYCNRTSQPLVWRPTALAAPAHALVLVMCPPRSHGLLRRYAWALIADGSDVSFALVRGQEVVPLGQVSR